MRFLLAAFLVIAPALAHDASAQYRFDTWTTENGLPQNGVREITQTPDGYLWFTTFDGLVRFDGVRFTTFSSGNTRGILNNRFTGLYSTPEGTLYATTMEDGILTVYEHGVFKTYPSDQVPGHYIQRIVPDDHGELRFLVEDDARTSKSWYWLRDGKFVFSEIDDPDEEWTRVSANGVVWKVTPTQATETRDGKTTTYQLPFKTEGFRANAFADSKGNLWMGEYAVHRLSGGRVETFGPAQGLKSSIHHSWWEEPDGSIWFAGGGGATEGDGMVRYLDGRFQAFGAESGLLSPVITSVFHDREGTTWLATSKGLARFRKTVLTGRSIKDGLVHSEVYPIYRDRQERIWIGTTKGIGIYEHGKFSRLDLRTADPHLPLMQTWRNAQMSVQSLWEDPKGRMWVGINGGLFIVEGSIARALPAVTGHHVFAIHGDRAGHVWAATNRGMLQFRDFALVRTLNVKDGLPNEFMTTVFEDRGGTLWFGGFGGLSRYADGKITNYTTKDGLSGSYVRSIYEDGSGTLWIGTYDEGLSRFRDGKFVTYNVDTGLFNNGVFAIQEDAGGNFWISSNQGIYRVRKQELNDFADRKITRIHSVGYGRQDGMLSTECNGGRQPASITDRDGRFWFPTQDGVVIVEPWNEKSNTLPPSVAIESAAVERVPIDIRSGELTVAPGLKNIEINFAGISLIKSEQIKYRYMLSGHDPGWIDAGARRTAYYSYLPPGQYQFLVTAANSDDVWNEQGARLALVLEPYFYETRSFYVIASLVLVVALFGAWKTSVYRLQASERRLERLVDEKTEALRKANEELQKLANLDPLTNVSNRRVFDDFLGDEWRRAIRVKAPVALLLIDIDHFKAFNDRHGHPAGDACLRAVATALKESIHRPTDLVARFGGEEFAIVLGGTDLPGALKVAAQVLERVKMAGVTVSVGAASTQPSAGAESELIDAADAALYRAKAGGRNQIAS